MAFSPQKQLTLKDVARRAGLSKSTVSAALLDHRRIAARTRKRVQLLAREMGYVRNPMAAALSTFKTVPVHALRVAVVSHLRPDDKAVIGPGHPMRVRLAELGYESEHFDLGSGEFSAHQLRNILYHRGYCGVIFDHVRENFSEVYSADWEAFCLVSAGRTYARPPCDLIRENTFEAVSIAWQEARQGGYQRIGFLLCQHDPPMLDDRDRETALWHCQRSLTAKEALIPPYLESHEDAPQIQKWLRRHKPDVVVGFNVLHHNFLSEMGWRIPEDVAFISLTGADPARKVAGVNCGRASMLVKCADHLDFLVRHKRTGFSDEPWEMLAPAVWVPGESLPGKS